MPKLTKRGFTGRGKETVTLYFDRVHTSLSSVSSPLKLCLFLTEQVAFYLEIFRFDDCGSKKQNYCS